MSRRIVLFRLDHRTVRDQRITSHVALTARATGCTEFVYSGEKDDNMEQSIRDVGTRWGGGFGVKYSKTVKGVISGFKGIVVHLTMYGEDHKNTVATLRDYPDEDLLIVVGGAKVPRYVYSLADFNTSIGWQPHSEVAATGIFMHCLLGDGPLYRHYDDAEISLDGQTAKSGRSERFS